MSTAMPIPQLSSTSSLKKKKILNIIEVVLLRLECHAYHLRLTGRRHATHRHPQTPAYGEAVPAECRCHRGHQCLDVDAALEARS